MKRFADLADPERRAASFDRTRDDHRRELAEDYVELIADLIEATGEARAVELAARLGVSQATVNNTVQRLIRDGLVSSEPYRAIFLTDEGKAVAQHARARHSLVCSFLESIGVDAETAAHDAEGIEHHVSEQTLTCMEEFLRARRSKQP